MNFLLERYNRWPWTRCWAEYMDLWRGINRRINCIMRKFLICIRFQLLWSSSNQGPWDGQNMWQAGRGEKWYCSSIWDFFMWIYHLRDFRVGGNIILKWILNNDVCTGCIWLVIGTKFCSKQGKQTACCEILVYYGGGYEDCVMWHRVVWYKFIDI
jgi:hypothetical protein